MQVTRKTAEILLICILPAVFIAAVLIPWLSPRSLLAANEARMRDIMRQYDEAGLLRLTDYLKSKSFVVIQKAFSYKPGDTDRMLDEFNRFNEENPGLRDVFEGLPELIHRAGSAFTQGTAFENKISFNTPPSPDHINIFFLKADPKGLTHNFSGNCEYIGMENVIICDMQFIENQFRNIDAIKKTYDLSIIDPQTRKSVLLSEDQLKDIHLTMQATFLMWVLGHEIGHAVLHKDLLLSGRALHFDLSYSPAEQAADTFVAERIVNDSNLANLFNLLIGEFIEQEFRREARQLGLKFSEEQVERVDFASTTKISMSYSRFKIPILLRALRIKTKLAADKYYVNIQNNVELIEEFHMTQRYVKFAVAVLALGVVLLVVFIRRA